MSFLLRLFGIRSDLITREEAALVFMEREVTFQYRPVVVELTVERTCEPEPSAPPYGPFPAGRNRRHAARAG